jgi:hypothetical protein
MDATGTILKPEIKTEKVVNKDGNNHAGDAVARHWAAAQRHPHLQRAVREALLQSEEDAKRWPLVPPYSLHTYIEPTKDK